MWSTIQIISTLLIQPFLYAEPLQLDRFRKCLISLAKIACGPPFVILEGIETALEKETPAKWKTWAKRSAWRLAGYVALSMALAQFNSSYVTTPMSTLVEAAENVRVEPIKRVLILSELSRFDPAGGYIRSKFKYPDYEITRLKVDLSLAYFALAAENHAATLPYDLIIFEMHSGQQRLGGGRFGPSASPNEVQEYFSDPYSESGQKRYTRLSNSKTVLLFAACSLSSHCSQPADFRVESALAGSVLPNGGTIISSGRKVIGSGPVFEGSIMASFYPVVKLSHILWSGLGGHIGQDAIHILQYDPKSGVYLAPARK